MWTEPNLLSVLWFLGWREFTAKITSEHQSSPVRLLFYLTCFLFIVIIDSFLHLKHGIQHKSLIKKNFTWNANLIQCGKINGNYGRKKWKGTIQIQWNYLLLCLKGIQYNPMMHLSAFLFLFWTRVCGVPLINIKGGRAYYQRMIWHENGKY